MEPPDLRADETPGALNKLGRARLPPPGSTESPGRDAAEESELQTSGRPREGVTCSLRLAPHTLGEISARAAVIWFSTADRDTVWTALLPRNLDGDPGGRGGSTWR